jgi:hypothetical protein
MESNSSEIIPSKEHGKHSTLMLATQPVQRNGTVASRCYYNLGFSAYPNLRQTSNTTQKTFLSTSPNVLFLDSDNGEICYFVLSDHYIVTCHGTIDGNDDLNVTILSRKYNDVLNIFSIPRSQRLKAVEGNWILFGTKSIDSINGSQPSQISKSNSIIIVQLIEPILTTAKFSQSNDV